MLSLCCFVWWYSCSRGNHQSFAMNGIPEGAVQVRHCRTLGRRPGNQPRELEQIWNRLHDFPWGFVTTGLGSHRTTRQRESPAATDTIIKADGKPARDGGVVSERFYLADAAFLVGLEEDDRTLLEKAHAALRDPALAAGLGAQILCAFRVYLDEGRTSGCSVTEGFGTVAVDRLTAEMGKTPREAVDLV